MSNPWFAGLSEEVRHHLVSRARTRTLAPEQRLYSRGDECDGVYAVLEGSVRIGGTSRDGRETVLDFYGPGSWFGELAAFDGLPRNNDAEAHGAVALMHVPLPELEALLGAHPTLSRAFLTLEARRLRIVLTALESYSVQSLEQRLANRLLLLSERYGAAVPEGIKIELHLPQEMLGRLIGSTRQRVNQILKEWEGQGLVRQQYGRIVLLHPDRLGQLAQL